jgi:hypothetical protein
VYHLAVHLPGLPLLTEDQHILRDKPAGAHPGASEHAILVLPAHSAQWVRTCATTTTTTQSCQSELQHP